jgi:hypothetical protein
MKTKERPIIFGAESIRAIYAGRKTQTRRVLKRSLDSATSLVEYNLANEAFVPWHWTTSGSDSGGYRTGEPFNCRYGYRGDRLWVREAWWQAESKDMGVGVPFVFYDEAQRKGSHLLGPRLPWGDTPIGRWGKRSPIFMPRWASRLVLDVAAVRVERVEDITEEDAKAEGYESRETFLKAFYDLNAHRLERGSNPFVWVVGFTKASE